LSKAPYDLSHLLDEDGPLEDGKGTDFIGMFLCAKQRGLLSGLKELWSRRRVKVAEPEADYVKRIGSIDCTRARARARAQVQEADSDEFTVAPASPVTDRSPSPPPRSIQDEDKLEFRYYQYSFGERRTPILGIGCYDGKITTNRMCSYGGAKEMKDGSGMERNFLSSWR
jgi:hypothetical protein